MKKLILLQIIFIVLATNAIIAQSIYHVNSSQLDNSGNGLTWATAKKDLQEAINLSIAGDEIWVKGGTYYPTHDANGNNMPADPRTKTFLLKSGVKIYGSFKGAEIELGDRNDEIDIIEIDENTTILSGEIQQDTDATNNTYRVVTALDLDSNSFIDFTVIQDGYAKGAIQTGAGMYVASLATNINNLKVNNCFFQKNYSANQGGAVFVESNTGDIIETIFNNCVFNNNNAAFDGGALEIVAFDGGKNTSQFMECSFNQNEANSGAAVHVLTDTDGEASPIFSKGRFVGNNSTTDAGAFSNYVRKGISNTTIDECVFGSNTAGGNGGGIFSIVIEGENNLSVNKSFFFGNEAGTDYSGGGIIIYSLNTAGTNNTKLQKCFFALNKAKFGGAISFLGEKGGINTYLFQSIFAHNLATYGGAIDSYVNTDCIINSFIINCTITENTATEGAAVETYQDNGGYSSNFIQNSIVWGNINFGSNKDIVVGSTTDNLRTSLVGNIDCSQWQVGNCSGNIFDKNPEFFSTDILSYPLSLCSPAINTGSEGKDTNGLESTDVLGEPRAVETIDMGVYEHQSPESRVLANLSQANTVPVSIRPNESVTFFSPTDCQIILNVASEGVNPLDSPVKTSVWLDAAQPQNYVSRHYEIDATTAPANATAKVTLYFTQQEFDNFNILNTVKLPIDGNDIAGNKANLLIEKRNGLSSDGSGNPATYSGGITTIDPADTEIIWNNNQNRWEVTFAVEGFSGFFVKTLTTNLPLPINLISFTGKATENGNILNWKTANEKDFSHFEVESSPLAPGRGISNGKFEKIGKINGNSAEIYEFRDTSSPIGGGGGYYRLKMIDLDGKFSYSKIIFISKIDLQGFKNLEGLAKVGNFFPNPSQGKTFVEINTLEKGNWEITSFDLTGKIINTETKFLQKGLNRILIEKLNQGINFVKFKNGAISEVRKVIKE